MRDPGALRADWPAGDFLGSVWADPEDPGDYYQPVAWHAPGVAIVRVLAPTGLDTGGVWMSSFIGLRRLSDEEWLGVQAEALCTTLTR